MMASLVGGNAENAENYFCAFHTGGSLVLYLVMVQDLHAWVFCMYGYMWTCMYREK